jgi:predicted metal-dependent hydrolase
MFKLRDYLYENIKDYEEFDQYIRQLHRNLNKDRSLIYENDPHSQLTSFSVNKGEEIAFCLKSKKTGQIHQLNLLMYVVLHEMGHVACPEFGHTELFKDIFAFLATEGVKLNIYKKINFKDNNEEYCGLTISDSII